MDLDNTSGWIFTDNTITFCDQLKFFLQGLCQIAKEQRGKDIGLQASWTSMDTTLLPDVESLKDRLAAAMQRAWQQKNNDSLQQYDTILQKLDQGQASILKIEVQHFPLTPDWYTILSPLLIHMSKCIVTFPGSLLTYVVMPNNMEYKLRETLNSLGDEDITWLEANLNSYCGRINTESDSPADSSWQDILIDDAFNEGTFNIFRRYCEEHDFIYMRDLIGFDFQELQKLHGLGAGKRHRIEDRYEQITSCIIKDPNIMEQNAPTIVALPLATIHPTLQDVPVDSLINLGIQNSLITELKRKGINSLGVLANLSHLEAKKTLRTGKALKALDLLPTLLKKDIYTLFRYLLIQLRHEHYKRYITLIKIANGQTLESIGQEQGVVRERIRQLKEKGFDCITSLLSAMVDRLFSECPYINVQQIMELYPGKKLYSKIILLWLRERSTYEYIDYAETFIPVISDCHIGDEIWQKVQSMLDECTSLSQLEEYFGEAYDYPYIDTGALKNLLEKNHYKIYGDIVLKNNTIESLCEPIIANYFPHGFSVKENFAELRIKCVKTYGERIVKEKLDNAALDNAFGLAKNIILCDRGKYTSIKNIRIQEIEPLLQKIVNIIEANALDRKAQHIRYQLVYDSFADELKKYNVNNRYLLQGLLKYTFPDQFLYNDRDTFERIGKDIYSISLNQRIKECLSSTKPLDKKVMQAKLGISAIQLALAISNDPELFFNGEGGVHYVKQYKYTNEDIVDLRQSINNIMKEYHGYCNSIMLWEHLKINNAQLLSNNNITTHWEIAGIAQAFLSNDYQFSRLHILQNNVQLSDIDWPNIIIYMMGTPTKIDFNDVSAWADKLKCPSSTKYMLQRKLQKIYTRISETGFILQENFVIREGVVASVKRLLAEKIKDNYIIISKISRHELAELPPLGNTPWNIFLLRSVIEHEFADEYRIIDLAKTDLRYERGIIVPQDSPCTDFTDLVIAYWQQKGRDSISEVEMSIALQEHFDLNYIPGELTAGNDRLQYKDAGFHIEEQQA